MNEEIVLTEHQDAKFNKLIAALDSGEKRVKLIGEAGTGKTTVANKIVQHLSKQTTSKPLYVAAPTNKALAILQSKVKNDRVTFKTVHQALSLKPDTNKEHIRFFPTFDRENDFPNSLACVVDEVSMLNTELLDYLDYYDFPIIFLGDYRQLNPVKEKISPIWTRNYPTFELTQPARQKAGSPILDLAHDLDLINFRKNNTLICDGINTGYVFNKDIIRTVERLAEVNGTDEMKYLAWTNNAVKFMNESVRFRLYGESPNRVQLGETLVFNSPLGNYYTNIEIKVEQLEARVVKMAYPMYRSRVDKSSGGIYPFDTIDIRVYIVNDDFYVVHEDHADYYKQLVKVLYDHCINDGWKWPLKHWFVGRFADVYYNHAITIHRSQGSTYKTAILNVTDAMFNKDIEERERLLYTAVTRPSQLLVLNV